MKYLYILVALPLTLFPLPSPQYFGNMSKLIYDKSEQNGILTQWHHELLETVGIRQESAETLFREGVKKEFLDRMALEYARSFEDLYIVVMFPPGDANPEPAKAILNNMGHVIYETKITLTKKGVKNFSQALYDVHHCNGWREDNTGIYDRFKALLTGKDQILHIFLFACDSLKNSIEAKRMVREKYASNNICHFTDYTDEMRHVSEIVFSESTIHFLNYANPIFSPEFVKDLKELKSYIDAHPEKNQSYAIDAGSVLAAYGIRESSDLDLILTPPFTPYREGLGLNNFTREKYHLPSREIIAEPKRHFYFKGVRFATLEEVYRLKKSKAKQKDLNDLHLIDQWIRKAKCLTSK